MPDKPQPAEAVTVFFSYSHKDKALRDHLATQLKMLEREKVISSWHDRKIGAGGEWAKEIDDHVKSADIILLLISSDFIASDYCYDIELKLAMERHEAGDARVVPVILRPCDWANAPFGKLNALPEDGLPATKWGDRDEAFLDVAKGIRKVAGEIIAERAPGGTADAPTAGAAKNQARSLIPRPPVVGFVARRDESGRDIVERLTEELAPSNIQLVALWGPGGAGKTTLAAEVVHATEHVFNGRVAWVSSLRHADLTLATLLNEIAAQLGRDDLRTLAPDPKAAQVAALVAAYPTLVVLDNFETIATEEQALCLDFLAQSAACPALVTTRSFVNRDDVSNVPLAAMELDEARDFLQRLVERTRKPSNFGKLDRDDLIRRCEANPLVLQWVVRQIDLAKRPQDVLNDLTQGEGDAAEHVFTRSFNLPQLGDDGRAALLALSLFTPHASRESLAEVAGFSEGLRRLGKAIENLSSLWLIETTEGNERIFLRGLTRELSKARLSKYSRADEFWRRYVAHFRGYASAHPQPTPEDLDALEVEKDNLLGATDAAFGMQDWESVMMISGELEYFLRIRGYWDEAIRNNKQGEAAARHAGQDLYVAFFMASEGVVLADREEYEEAERVSLEAMDIFRKSGHEQNTAVCLHRLGIIAQDRGNTEEAQQRYNESLDIARRLGDEGCVAATLHQLGKLMRSQGNLKEARRFYTESLEIKRGLSKNANVATTLHALANLVRDEGDLMEARRLYNESLEITSKLGDKVNMALIAYNMGLLEGEEGNKTEAARLFLEALHIFEKLGSPLMNMAREQLAKVTGESVEG